MGPQQRLRLHPGEVLLLLQTHYQTAGGPCHAALVGGPPQPKGQLVQGHAAALEGVYSTSAWLIVGGPNLTPRAIHCLDRGFGLRPQDLDSRRVGGAPQRHVVVCHWTGG